nr:carcinoembryonic antigen-related cell adhesion molecule 4-like isoform X2 [Castor canadensis]
MERGGVHIIFEMGSPPHPMSAPKPPTSPCSLINNLSFSRANHLHDFRDHKLPASTPGRGHLDSSTSLAPLPGPRAAVPIYE